MEKILLKTLDRSEITINEAFELCFPERNIDQISNKDSRAIHRWSKTQPYKFVRMTDQLVTAK